MMARKVALLFLSLSSSLVYSRSDHDVDVEHKEANSAVKAMAEPYATAVDFSTVVSTPEGELTVRPCTVEGISTFCWIANGATLNIPKATTPDSASTASPATSDTNLAWDMTILINNNSTTTIGEPAATTGNNLTTTVLVEGTSRTTLYPNTTQLRPTLTQPPLGTATASQGTGTGFVSPSGGWNITSCVGYVCPGGPRPGWTGWSGRPRPTGGWPRPPNNGTGTSGYNVSITGTGGVATSYRVTSTITSSITVTNTSCCIGSFTSRNSSSIGPINTSLPSSPSFPNNTATANATASRPTESSFPSGTGDSNSTSESTIGAPFPNGTTTANATAIGPSATGPKCWTLTNGTYSRISTCTGASGTASPWLDWNNTAPFPTGTGASRPTFTGTRPSFTSTVGPGTGSLTVTSWNSTVNPGARSSKTTSSNFTFGPGTGFATTTTRNSTTGPGTVFPTTTSGKFTIDPGRGTTSQPLSHPSSDTGINPSTTNHTGTLTATISASFSNTINATAPFPVPSLNTSCTSTHGASSGYSTLEGTGAGRPPRATSASGSPTSTNSRNNSSTSSIVSGTMILPSPSSSSNSTTNTTSPSSVSSHTPSISSTLTITISPIPATTSTLTTSSSPSFSINATLGSLTSPNSPSSLTSPSLPDSPAYPSITTTATIDRGVLQCVESIGSEGQTLGMSCRTTFETSVLATGRDAGRGSGSGVAGPSGGGWWGDYRVGKRGSVGLEAERGFAKEEADEERGELMRAVQGMEGTEGTEQINEVKEVVRRGLRIPEGREGYAGGVYGREAVLEAGVSVERPGLTGEEALLAVDQTKLSEDKKGSWVSV